MCRRRLDRDQRKSRRAANHAAPPHSHRRPRERGVVRDGLTQEKKFIRTALGDHYARFRVFRSPNEPRAERSVPRPKALFSARAVATKRRHRASPTEVRTQRRCRYFPSRARSCRSPISSCPLLWHKRAPQRTPRPPSGSGICRRRILGSARFALNGRGLRLHCYRRELKARCHHSIYGLHGVCVDHNTREPLSVLRILEIAAADVVGRYGHFPPTQAPDPLLARSQE